MDQRWGTVRAQPEAIRAHAADLVDAGSAAAAVGTSIATSGLTAAGFGRVGQSGPGAVFSATMATLHGNVRRTAEVLGATAAALSAAATGYQGADEAGAAEFRRAGDPAAGAG